MSKRHIARTMTNQAGTILPTRTSLDINNAFARSDKDARGKAAQLHGLTDLDIRKDHGETRYYGDGKHYAVIGRDMLPKWFDVREDGDYPCKVGFSPALNSFVEIGR